MSLTPTKVRHAIVFGLIALMLSTIPLYPTGAAQKSRVVEAFLKADEGGLVGPCPVTFNFTGYITTDGPGTVTYTFTRSDGASGPVQNLYFKAAGTQSVSTNWTLGDASSLSSYEGWQALKILSPNEMESSHETGKFVMKCGSARNVKESFSLKNVIAGVTAQAGIPEKKAPRPQAPAPASSSIDNQSQTQVVNGQYGRVGPITNQPSGGFGNDIDDNGNPRTSSPGESPRPFAGSFRVTLNGYSVNHQTRDNAFETDGVGDEVTLVFNTAIIDSTGRFVPRRWGNIFSSFMGQQPRNEIRAGTGSERGGLITGDGFPTATPWRRLTPTNPGVPPNVLFDGELTQRTNAALIVPTIWETDNTETLRATFASAIERDRPSITSSVVGMIAGSAREVAGPLPGSSLGIGNTVTLGRGPLGLGQVDDRPIGMTTLGGGFGFTPQALVLTYNVARELARADFGFGRGVIPMRYTDDRSLEGDYTLFIQVEELGGMASAPCAANFTATFNGTATMTTTNENARGPFTSDLRLALSFEDCGATVRITDFPPISVTFGTPVGDNTTTVTMPSGGTGHLEYGRMDVPVALRFGNTILAAGTSFADMTLSTSSPGGSPLRDGNITLVGLGRFRGGFLNGSNCTITAAGTISPAP
jgi:hypothetical protein